MTDFKGDVINAGHLIIRVADAKVVIPINRCQLKGKLIKALPASHEYVGVVVCSKPTNEPPRRHHG